jgi:hypothetical protein
VNDVQDTDEAERKKMLETVHGTLEEVGEVLGDFLANEFLQFLATEFRRKMPAASKHPEARDRMLKVAAERVCHRLAEVGVMADARNAVNH